jgi:hypothetical protein
VKGVNLYNLTAVNQLERIFVSLCEYELYVSESVYKKYYQTIIEKTNQHDDASYSPLIKRLGGKREKIMDKSQTDQLEI